MLATSLCGCAGEGEELVIVSPWPAAERSEVAAEFRRWAAATPGTASGPVRVTWIALAQGDDITRAVRRRVAPDLVLGAPAVALRRLARDEWLVPVERTAHPLWCVTWRGPISLVLNPALGNGPAAKSAPRAPPLRGGVDAAPEPPAARASAIAFDDFRHDPVALAWARGELAAGTWAEGYARLVRCAGDPRRIGRQPGAAAAALERGAVAMVPWVEVPYAPSPRGFLPVVQPEKPIEWSEGVALVRGGRNPALAQEFVRFLAGRGQAESPSPRDAGGKGDPDSGDDLADAPLLADLLGATLVDAQDELWAAWAKLKGAGDSARAERWLTEPPPWPPASVDKLLKRGEEGAALLETLTAEIVPEADVRNWLLRSWLAPARHLDGRLLAELAGALDGRVAREPRFRAWLRGEWTAWARQRYRRVARLAAGAATN
jgi:hypothetical protein